MRASERLEPRQRKGELLKDAVEETRQACYETATKLIAAVEREVWDRDDFTNFFINLPEFEAFEAACERLSELCPEQKESES